MPIQALTLYDLASQPAMALGTYKVGGDGTVALTVLFEGARALLEEPMTEGVTLYEEEPGHGVIANVLPESGSDFLLALVQQMKISNNAYYDYNVEYA